MKLRFLDKAMDIVAITMALFLAIFRPLVFTPLFPATNTLWGTAWLEIFLWLLTSGLVFWLLVRHGLFHDYVNAWKENWPLILFIGIAFISLIWSVSPGATLYRTLVLLFSTLLGAYLGIRYDNRSLLNILFWFGAVVVILCFAITLYFPWFGTMQGFPYYGAWNGIFWHKNYMGSILALLNGIFLIRFMVEVRCRDRTAILDGLFYLLALALVYLSRSATGYIVTILLNFLVFLAWAWLKWKNHLRPVHYYLILGAFAVAGGLLFLNLNAVLGLFNRDSSFTGRVPMWMYLWAHVIHQRPWLGYGFGALWTIEAFRIQVQQAVGWPFPVQFADNGFIDILLHVGIIGLGVFLVNFFLMYVKTIKFAFRRRTLEYFLPLIVMIYALVANISFSLFLEVDAYVWLLMVACLFLTVRRD